MAMQSDDEFRARMHALLASDEDLERAKKLIRDYWLDGDYTGPHFDRLRDADHPNEITERDIVAVTMLGVDIPERVSIWLLSAEGRERVGELLNQVPADAEFQVDGHLLDDGSDLDLLWKLLKQASWPRPDPSNQMHTAKISKLLAAKRPGLVPIYDSRIRDMLSPVANYWSAYRRALDENGLLLFGIAVAGAPEEIPLIRKIDSLLWMLGKPGTYEY